MKYSDDRVVALVEALGGLIDDMGEGCDEGGALQGFAGSCSDLLAVDAVGCLLVDTSNDLHAVAAVPGSTALDQILRVDCAAGPSHRAHASGDMVVMPNLDGASSYREFAAVAGGDGYRAAHAFPMRRRADRLGVVIMLGTVAGSLPRADLEMARASVGVAAAAIAVGRASTGHAERTEQLQSALASRIVIEQAKGLVAAHTGGDFTAAFTVIRATARNTNTRLRDVAVALVDGRMSAQELALKMQK